MKIAILKEYANNKIGVDVMEVTEGMLPLDVAPSMRCEELRELPNRENPTSLGLSERHLNPTDVIVVPISEGEEQEIRKVYSCPLVELKASKGLTPEAIDYYELELRAEEALNLVHSWIS